MSEPSMDTYLTGREPSTKPGVHKNRSLIPEGTKTALVIALLFAVGYLLYDNYQFQQKSRAELTLILNKLQELDNYAKAGEAKISNLMGEISETQHAVGSAKAELHKTAEQIQAEGQRTKAELSQALSTKADSVQVHKVEAQVQAARSEADTRFGQVTSEVGGVRTDVVAVKSDLATTRRDLEGTQRQLVDVRESLGAAVARNAAELAELRRKGERDYFEFEIPRKNQLTRVEDIRLILKKTDAKKGKYNIEILVDDNKLEKKDRVVNEPLQFLVGRNRVRYELVVNWVQKDRAGGYLSIPIDRTLASERPVSN